MKTKRSHKTNYTNKKSNHNSTKSKILLTGVTLSSALVMSRPIIPAAVYAATNRYDWTKQEDLDIDIADTTFARAATSASGSTLITSVGTFGSGSEFDELFPLYISNNYGVTWTDVADTADPGIANVWSSVDVSNDGQTMVIASMGGYDLENEGQEVDGKILLSNNGGTSWEDIPTEYSGSGLHVRNVVVSGDGSTIAYVTGDSTVYVSDNNGANWTSNSVNDEENWLELGDLSISDDGDKLLTGVFGSGSQFGEVFMSNDGGASWTDFDPDPGSTMNMVHTAMSADGSKIAVAGWGMDEGGENDAVYVSSNDGASWTNVTPDDPAWNLWGAIDMSADGSKLAVYGVEYPEEGGEEAPITMHVSEDSGANWTAEDPTENESPGNIMDYYMSSLDLNASGSRVIIGSVGAVYTGYNASLDGSSTVTFDDAEGGKTIALSTPDGTTITCHEAVKESGLAATDNAYTYPLGLIDFCFSGANTNNEISIVFVTDLKPNQVVARKYNTTNSSYSTLNDASITETTLNNQHALQVTYNLSDNGPLDLDPNPGSIKDPVGLATQDVSGPNTGIAPQSSTDTTTILLTGLAVTAGLLTAPLRRAASRLSVKK